MKITSFKESIRDGKDVTRLKEVNRIHVTEEPEDYCITASLEEKNPMILTCDHNSIELWIDGQSRIFSYAQFNVLTDIIKGFEPKGE